jgi:hypothetical protein
MREFPHVEAVAPTPLWAEFIAARTAMAPTDRALLLGHGIPLGTILFLVGAARIERDRSRQFFEMAEDGLFAFVTPVMVAWPDTPEAEHPAQAVRFGDLVDLVAWHPARPESWALRVGAAEWLGAIEPQYMDPEPVPVHRTVLSWLQAGACGLVPLCRTPEELRRVLAYCARIEAQDRAHAIALRRALRLPWVAPPVSMGAAHGA